MTRRSHQRKKFGKRRWPVLIVAVILAALVLADRQGWLLTEQSDEMSQYDGQLFRVVRVIDGDTITIDAFDPVEQRPTTRIRLWGIDCPETAKPGRPAAEPFADEAAAFTRELLSGGSVVVTLESHRVRGNYGRLLAHLETADGRRVNELLVAAGLAEADDRWPHEFLKRYEEAERRAKIAELGIWSDR